jgi:hypothetical protein
MINLEEFKSSEWNFVAYQGDKIVFKSKSKALDPLVEFVKTNPEPGIIIFDRIVGRAAALLMTLIQPAKVYTPVISKSGRQVLDEAGIEIESPQTVEYIMGIASEDSCKWEKLVIGKSAEEFWEIVK